MRGIALLTLLVLLVPGVQALDADRARGDGPVTVRADQATVTLNGEAHVLVTRAGSLDLVDDVGHNLAPRGPGLPAMNGYTAWDRTREQVQVDAGVLLRLRPAQPDARIIIVGASVGATTEHAWTVQPHRDDLLEASHVYRSSDLSEYYYEYRARHATNWTATATWSTSGSLHVYLWGVDVLADLPDGSFARATGNWTDEVTLAERWHHNVHGILVVAGQLDATSVPGSAFADQVELSVAGQILLEDAVGTLGPGIVSGMVRVDGGRYTVNGHAGGLDIAVQDLPTAVNGVQLQEPPVWPWLVGGAGMLAVAVVIALVRGSPATWTRRSVLHLEAAHPRRAAWAARRALIGRGVPLAWMILGHAHAVLRHHRRAERAFSRAYRTMSGGDRAVCAYEAARAAATGRRGAQAGFWLRLAGQLNVSLLANALEEPDFRHVAGDTQFSRQVQLAAGVDLP